MVIDWIATVFLLGGVGLITLGDTRLIAFAMVLNLVGDALLIVFFVLNFNVAFIVLNVVFVLLSVFGIYKWRDRSDLRGVIKRRYKL